MIIIPYIYALNAAHPDPPLFFMQASIFST